MNKILLAAAAVSTLAFAASAQASVTIYNNEAAFLAAAGSVVTEDFNDNVLVSGLSFVSTAGSVSGGLFNDRAIIGSQDTTFSFNSAKAFGGTFDETPGGFGQGLRFTVNGNVVGTLYGANPGTFFGFISTDAFTSVLIQGDSGCCAETYNLDNLQLGAGGVPEPATWALMIAGFGLAGAALRRRQVIAA